MYNLPVLCLLILLCVVQRRDQRLAEQLGAREKHKLRAKQAIDNPVNNKLRRDPGVPDLSSLHAALERRSLSLTLDRASARAEAFAKKRAQEQHKQESSSSSSSSKHAASSTPVTSVTGGKYQPPPGSGPISNDARDVASRKHYWSEMVKVVDMADIILEVLDARDPLGCRCEEVERLIQSKMDRSGGSAKRIILILNKIDLIPHDNLVKWIKYMRREFPCIAIKSNTQQQSSHLKQDSHVTHASHIQDTSLFQHNATLGASQLIQLLKNYSRSQDLKKNLVVGIIGYPNVGKSSLINSLTRARRAAVGNMPGLTKNLQTIRLDGNIQLIDSPGVMFSRGRNKDGSEDEGMLLRNCLRFEQLQDPISTAYLIVSRCTLSQLKQAYSLSLDFEDAEQFLFLVARQRGKLKKGGIPDAETAAKIVIKDWNDGKIPYHTEPPVIVEEEISASSSSSSSSSTTQILSHWSQEFDLDALIKPVVEGGGQEEGEEGGQTEEMEEEEGQEEGRSQSRSRPRHQIGRREIIHEEDEEQKHEQEQEEERRKNIIPRPKDVGERMKDESSSDNFFLQAAAATSSSSSSSSAPAAAAASSSSSRPPSPSSRPPALSSSYPQLNQERDDERKKEQKKQRRLKNAQRRIQQEEMMREQTERIQQEIHNQQQEHTHSNHSSAAAAASSSMMMDVDDDENQPEEEGDL